MQQPAGQVNLSIAGVKSYMHGAHTNLTRIVLAENYDENNFPAWLMMHRG
jgi:hypothetical protein